VPAVPHTQLNTSDSLFFPRKPEVEKVYVVAYPQQLTHALRVPAARERCLERKALTLRLEVVDDGRGLTPDQPPGVGLPSMQTRAAELGGHCAVAARPEGGTMVGAWLPLVPHAPAAGALTAVPDW
jgi:hypothetical protein